MSLEAIGKIDLITKKKCLISLLKTQNNSYALFLSGVNARCIFECLLKFVR